jgi:hypothetical protein
MAPLLTRTIASFGAQSLDCLFFDPYFVRAAVNHGPHQYHILENADFNMEICPLRLSQALAGWRTTFVQPSSRLSKFL